MGEIKHYIRVLLYSGPEEALKVTFERGALASGRNDFGCVHIEEVNLFEVSNPTQGFETYIDLESLEGGGQ
jgi:hypothetical protein